jgi:hypothetical protein
MPDLSMRSVEDNSIGGDDVHDPTTTFQGCALATDTPSPMAVTILWSSSTATGAPVPASNRRTSKNKYNKQLNCKCGDGNQSDNTKLGFQIR